MAQKQMTFTEFRSNLADLKGAATDIGLKKKWIMDCMDNVRANFSEFEKEWQAPSEVTFSEVRQWFERSYVHLDALLDEIVTRLWKAYDNYHDVELKNIANLKLPPHGDDSRKTRSEMAVVTPRHDGHQEGHDKRRLAESMLAVVTPKDE